MTTTPIVLLAPAPGMIFVAMPSGATYVSDQNALVKITNGSITDQFALIAAGCATLEPNAGGAVTPQPGTAYTVQPYDENNWLMFTNASPVTVTLPNNLPVGFAVNLVQGGAGQVTPQAATGGSVVTPNVAATPGQYCYLFCIVVSNVSGATAQWNVICQPSQTGGGVIGASTLASLYSQDASAHYTQYSIAQVLSDSTTANNGWWLKTGAGNGSGNWTQQSTITLASVGTQIVGEIARAEAVEASLQSLQDDIVFPDDNIYAGGIFDDACRPLLGLLPSGGVVGLLVSQQNPPQIDPVFPDDASSIEGDMGFSDANGVLLLPVPNSIIAAAADSAIAAALASYASEDQAWPDDTSQFQGDIGFADPNGNILYAIDPATITASADTALSAALAIAETTSIPTVDAIWPDDVSSIPGDTGLADFSNHLLNCEFTNGVYTTWNAYADPTSSSTITAISPTQAAYPIASARGANASTPAPSIPNCDGRPDSTSIVRWTDNGTADGIATRSGGYFTPAIELREFNFLGAQAVMALGGITKIVFIPMIGQSLSNGTTASAFTTTNIFNRAFMFNGGPMPYQEFTATYQAPGALCQDSQLSSLLPLVEIEKPGYACGETYGGGISYWMSLGTNLEATSTLVYATLGQGGAGYAANQMQQYVGTTSNSMFASVIRCVERLAAWCRLNGIALEIPCIIHDQGENDYATAAVTYYNDLVANQAAYNAAVAAVFTKFGLTNTGPGGAITEIPFLCIQPSSWAFYSDTTAPSMVAYPSLVIANPAKFALIGPQYWNANYNPASGQHMGPTGLGYRQCAEYTGRAIQRLRAGMASEAVYATAVSNSGLTLSITFNTQSQLVHDTSVVSDPNGQWGIELAANGSNVALSSPVIVGTNEIQFTLASSISGMSCVLGIADYAYGTLGQTSGPTTSARAPFHDSSSDTMSSAAGGLTMVNYPCAQQVSFTGA